MKKNKKHYDKYKKFDVVYADFGRNPHGVQGGIRPGIVVSCDASNHGGAPQISVVPLSSKLKDNPVHVIVDPSEIRGYALSNRSDFMPEDIQTLNKGCGDMLALVRYQKRELPKAAGAEYDVISSSDMLQAEKNRHGELGKYVDCITHTLSLQSKKKAYFNSHIWGL